MLTSPRGSCAVRSTWLNDAREAGVLAIVRQTYNGRMIGRGLSSMKQLVVR